MLLKTRSTFFRRNFATSSSAAASETYEQDDDPQNGPICRYSNHMLRCAVGCRIFVIIPPSIVSQVLLPAWRAVSSSAAHSDSRVSRHRVGFRTLIIKKVGLHFLIYMYIYLRCRADACHEQKAKKALARAKQRARAASRKAPQLDTTVTALGQNYFIICALGTSLHR